MFAQSVSAAAPLLVRPLPDGLTVGCDEDEGLRYTNADRYGNRLTFTTPADLGGPIVPDDSVPWNRARLAFVLALPPDSRIVLFWC